MSKEREIANHYVVINEMAERLGVSRKQADAAYRTFVEVVTDLVKEGKVIKLPKFLTIDLVDKAAKEARNPRTGETIQVPEKVVARIKPKAFLNEAAQTLKVKK